ncbi:hypothetical protein DFJ73DRAFT_814217 [Zopfochytrium polystomum]|nr:hypothetical protein DFJ73DRAFT_814217 [Zopfochytrium polystomum]
MKDKLWCSHDPTIAPPRLPVPSLALFPTFSSYNNQEMNGAELPLPRAMMAERRYGILNGPGPVSRKRLWLAAATLLYLLFASRQIVHADPIAPSHYYWRVLLLFVFTDIITHSKNPATSRWEASLVVIRTALTIISIKFMPTPVLRDIALLETFVLLFLTLFSFHPSFTLKGRLPFLVSTAAVVVGAACLIPNRASGTVFDLVTMCVARVYFAHVWYAQEYLGLMYYSSPKGWTFEFGSEMTGTLFVWLLCFLFVKANPHP